VLPPAPAAHGSDSRAPRPAPQGKENVPGTSKKDCDIKDCDLAPHLTCGLCSKLVAAPLVVSCGHMFCGSCLCDYLAKDPMCPTCQVGLRAVPVRCLAVDAVVDAVVGALMPREKERFGKRVADGKSAADRINKTFWWLAPQAVPIAGASAGQVGLSFAAAQHPAMAQHPPRARQQQHRQHPRRHTSAPQLPKQQQRQQQFPAVFPQVQSQPLLPLEQAMLAHIGPLGLAQHQPPIVHEPLLPHLLFPQQQDLLFSMLQRLNA
jgi:hypothetical protein